MPSNGAAHGGAGLKGRLELWGGHECTVNRVQDVWFDQTIRAGHENRFEDLAMFADLGIRKLRYPALWERISPHSPDQRDFTWTDERLTEIRRSGMEPVVTLCHHGSGPHYTSLLDESFATGLAHHAAAVAKRYPWVSDYTPVNEPLTTARFSALYGFWYPHHREERSFWLALLNEIDATRLNVAGVSVYARFEETTPEEFRRIMEVNFMGQVHGAQAALPHLKARGGALIAISSVESIVALPLHSAYTASKHAVEGAMDALRRELMADKAPVSVTSVKPATINTPFFTNSRSKMDVVPKGPPPVYEPTVVAQCVLYAAEHPVRDLFAGGAGKGMAAQQMAAPKVMDSLLARFGIPGSRTDTPAPGGREGNLYAHIASDPRVSGDLSSQSRRFSLYTWMELHPAVKVAALGAVAGGWALRSRRRDRRGSRAQQVAA